MMIPIAKRLGLTCPPARAGTSHVRAFPALTVLEIMHSSERDNWGQH